MPGLAEGLPYVAKIRKLVAAGEGVADGLGRRWVFERTLGAFDDTKPGPGCDARLELEDALLPLLLRGIVESCANYDHHAFYSLTADADKRIAAIQIETALPDYDADGCEVYTNSFCAAVRELKNAEPTDLRTVGLLP